MKLLLFIGIIATMMVMYLASPLTLAQHLVLIATICVQFITIALVVLKGIKKQRALRNKLLEEHRKKPFLHY